MFRTLRGIMVAMRRVLTYAMVWGGATALAMLLVWFAARPVVRGAVFGEAPITPMVAGTPSSPSPSPRPMRIPPVDSSTFATVPSSPSPSVTSSSRDHTYVTRGGRVVLAFTPTMAQLISATPNPGYEVRTWRGIGWLQVDFRRGTRYSGVMATWNDHPPEVTVRG
jgi:hypothetical protein